MMITKKSLSRRTLLRGAGAALSLPFLDAMRPAFASAAVKKPNVRLGFVYVPNGIIDLQGEWTPTAEGAAFDFASTAKALEPFRDHILMLSGLAQVEGRALGDGPGDHARAGATWLTGVHPKKTEGADIHVGPSADQIAAKELGQYTQLASLELGIEGSGTVGGCDSGYSCAYTNTVSWRSPTTPVPVEVNPRNVFERLFGDGDSTDAKSRMERLEQENSILDFVSEDVSRINSGLGKRDRSKLNEYLDAVRDLERRIQKAEQQNADIALPVMERPAGAPEDYAEHVKLMVDLEVMAFQTDMTRVCTFMMAHEGSNRSYRAIDVPDGHHSCTHHQHDPEKISKTIKINRYHVDMLAYLINKLKSTPDVDGTLLDNSMIMYGSSIGDGNLHTHHNLPILVAGGGAGALKSGRHIRYPNETPLNNLLITLLDKSGVRVDQFGDSTGEVRGLSGV